LGFRLRLGVVLNERLVLVTGLVVVELLVSGGSDDAVGGSVGSSVGSSVGGSVVEVVRLPLLRSL